MVLLTERIHGRWMRGKNSPASGTVLDFQAGRLITDCDPRPEVTLDGPPADFVSDAGDSGNVVLTRLLRPPKLEELRYGAFREAISFVNSVALYGFGETRTWENKTTYIADTGEGSCGMVKFGAEGCVAAMINYDPHRVCDVASQLELAPEELRGQLRKVCASPMLNAEHQRQISAVFWSEAETLTGAEPWPTLYEFGAEILRREMLKDDEWLVEAQSYYEPKPQVLETAIRVARRLVPPSSVYLSDAEEATLLPQAGPHVAAARKCLREVGIQLRSESPHRG